MNTGSQRSFITCRVGEGLVGIGIEHVQEINRHVDATFVPRLEPEVKGLINLRGNLVTVLDLVRILHARDIANTHDTRNVIVHLDNERFGLLVDGVGDVSSCEIADIKQLPSHFDPDQAMWFEGLVQLERQILLVLDVGAVVRGPMEREART